MNPMIFIKTVWCILIHDGKGLRAKESMLCAIAMITVALAADAQIIPASRVAPWVGNVGVPGGIPNVQQQFCNVRISIPGSALVAKGDGVVDDTAAIAAALERCPNNSYIYLPPGTYKVATLAFNKSGVVLRGAGQGKTTIIGGPFIFTGQSHLQKFFNVAGPTTVIPQGSSQMIINTNGIPPSTAQSLLPAPGVLLWVGVTNDHKLIDPVGFEGDQSAVFTSFAEKNMGQMVEVTQVAWENGTNVAVTFAPPAVWNYSNSLGVVVKQINNFVRNTGMEDVTLLNPGGKSVSSMVIFYEAAFCWLRNVGIEWAYNDAVNLRGAFRCSIVESHLKGTHYDTPGGGYGFRLDLLPSFNLIENNIIEGLRASITIEGGAGNVAAYNYIPWATNYNDVLQKQLSFHASSPAFNLFEGNKAPGCGADNTHGSSVYNTFFRNHVYATNFQGNVKGGSRTYNWAVRLDAKAHSYNFVGNVFGVPGWAGAYQSEASTGTGFRSSGANYIWSIGYTTDGDGDPLGNDPMTLATLLRYANYNYLQKINVLDPKNVENASETSIPASLYLSKRPAWFDGFQWPPIGPDVNSLVSRLPAEARLGRVTPPGNLRVN